MPASHLFLGIDGGGSSTRAVLSDSEGRVLGIGSAGPSNPFSSGLEGSRTAIDLAVGRAFSTAGVPRAPAAGACLGIAGLVTPVQEQGLREVAENLSLGLDILIHHDLRIALTGSLLGTPGAVLVAGTGSACYARSAGGREVITGGKGPLAGDSGSGYWIAHRALRTAVKQLDGRLRTGPLAVAVLDYLGINKASQLPGRLHREGLTPSKLAGFAPRVIALAAEGDEVAASIIGAAQEALTAMVEAAARQAWLESLNLVFAGGIATSEPFGTGLRDRILKILPDTTFPSSALPPAGGAVLEAFMSAGIEITSDGVERLQDGLQSL
ncbi:MAG: hypothetical protein HKN29_02420 [Rhodothermales bacterium]|nr:hypothetical protein [Rhodothermales bacterium]